MTRKVRDPEHQQIFVALNNLAMCKKQQGDLDAAEPYLREVASSYQRIYGSDPDAGQPLLNLGGVLFEQGKHAEAVHVLQSSLEMLQGTPYRWRALMLLGKSHVALGDAETGEPCLWEAVEVGHVCWGERNHSTQEASMALAEYLIGLGNYSDAEGILRGRAAICEAWRGAGDPMTRDTLKRPAGLYDDWAKPDEAEQCRAKLSVADASAAAAPPSGVNRH